MNSYVAMLKRLKLLDVSEANLPGPLRPRELVLVCRCVGAVMLKEAAGVLTQ